MVKWKKKNSTYKIFILIILLGYFIYCNYFKESEAHVFKDNTVEENLEVEFIDVGQGDAILIRSGTSNMLIDAGNNEDGELLVEYFRSLDITNFKYVVGTHAHEDHIGGMDDIIDNFDIETFYMPDTVTTTKTFEDVLDSLEAKNYNFNIPKEGEILYLGEVKLEVIHIGNDESDLNSTSIILRLDHGNNSFLFTGDATSDVEKSILDKNIDVDILKVAHHGSKYSSTLTFLKRVSPKYAIIEVGENNSYSHPSDIILKRLASINATIYRTDRDGTIIIESDGSDYDIKMVKTNTNG